MPRHQGHRRILLAFIIVIAMSTSAVQYYHLRRCLLRHCPSLHSPRSSSLYLTHTTAPRVDRFVNESRFSIEFWFCFGSLVFFDVSIEISIFISCLIYCFPIFTSSSSIYTFIIILLPRNCENSEIFDRRNNFIIFLF